MAPPACDRNDDIVRYSLWTTTLHRRCFAMQRMAVVMLLLHCRTRKDSGIGALPVELLLLILSHVEVAYE